MLEHKREGKSSIKTAQTGAASPSAASFLDWYYSHPGFLHARSIRASVHESIPIETQDFEGRLIERMLLSGFPLPPGLEGLQNSPACISAEIGRWANTPGGEQVINYLSFSDWRGELQVQQLVDTLARLHERFGRLTIVDLGGGKGYALREMLDVCEHLGIPARGFCVDIRKYPLAPASFSEPQFWPKDRAPLEAAMSRFRSSIDSGAFNFTYASADELPREWSGFAHFVYSAVTACYVADPIHMLEEAYRILAPGGIARMYMGHAAPSLEAKADSSPSRFRSFGESLVPLWNEYGCSFETSLRPNRAYDTVIINKHQESPEAFCSGLMLSSLSVPTSAGRSGPYILPVYKALDRVPPQYGNQIPDERAYRTLSGM